MTRNKENGYNRKTNLLLIFGPILGIPVTLTLFSIVNTVNIQVGLGSTTLSIINFLLGLSGLISVIGIFTVLPYGVYRHLKKNSEERNSNIIKSEDGLKFIENVAFSPIENLYRFMLVLTIISILANVYLGAVTLAPEQLAINPTTVPAEAVGLIETYNFPIFIISMAIVTIISGIVFLIWMHKAYKNLYHFKNKTKNTPGWVIADFFIPIVNLFAPYKNMKELYAKSYGTAQIKMILAWWLISIFADFTSRFSDEYMYIALFIVSIAASIISSILGIIIIKKVTESQTAKSVL